MNVIFAWSLLAQMDRFDGLRNRFSGPQSHFGWSDAITALAVVIAISALLYFVNRWHSRYTGQRSYNSPRALFRELCQVHQLNRHQKKLLKRVARWQRMNQPARLFLEPERFEPANLSPDLERYSAELLELRSQLFTFEVAPESRDTMTVSPAENMSRNPVAAKPSTSNPPQETVGAAAFAGTRLEETQTE